MSKWRPTPKERLITASRLNPATGEWDKCEYTELRKGDIFKSYDPEGVQLEAVTLEECGPDVCAVVTSDPVKGHTDDQNEGYMIEVTTGPFGALIQRVSN